MSDGTDVRCSPWCPTVIKFRESLWGTDMFWTPLEEEHTVFSAEELKGIRQIAEREGRPGLYGHGVKNARKGAKDAKPPKGTLRASSGFSRIETNARVYVIQRQQTKSAIEVLFGHHEKGGIDREAWFHAVYSRLNREEPAYSRWKPLDWFKGKADERQFYFDLIDPKARSYFFRKSVQAVERIP